MAFFGFVAVLFPLFANEYSLGNRAGAKGKKIPKRFGQIWFLASRVSCFIWHFTTFLLNIESALADSTISVSDTSRSLVLQSIFSVSPKRWDRTSPRVAHSSSQLTSLGGLPLRRCVFAKGGLLCQSLIVATL
jgi:hypothetical protein